MDRFVKGKHASEIIGVHQRTLYNWERKGNIETRRSEGNIRLYNIDKYYRNNENTTNDKNKMNINYVRVSSIGQKDDLERQKRLIMKLYPNNYLIEDIGSGINMNRRGLNKLIDLAIEGKVVRLLLYIRID